MTVGLGVAPAEACVEGGRRPRDEGCPFRSRIRRKETKETSSLLSGLSIVEGRAHGRPAHHLCSAGNITCKSLTYYPDPRQTTKSRRKKVKKERFVKARFRRHPTCKICSTFLALLSPTWFPSARAAPPLWRCNAGSNSAALQHCHGAEPQPMRPTSISPAPPALLREFNPWPSLSSPPARPFIGRRVNFSDPSLHLVTKKSRDVIGQEPPFLTPPSPTEPHASAPRGKASRGPRTPIRRD